jgi:CspA family cold shock protein
MNRQQGTVKWFSRDKGWGFVRLEDGSEIFVHHSDIEGEGHKTLQDDERVEFAVEHMDKGPRARDVRRLGGAATGESRTGARSREQAPRQPRQPRAPESRSTGPQPLAEQLRKRLSKLFPGLS